MKKSTTSAIVLLAVGGGLVVPALGAASSPPPTTPAGTEPMGTDAVGTEAADDRSAGFRGTGYRSRRHGVGGRPHGQRSGRRRRRPVGRVPGQRRHPDRLVPRVGVRRHLQPDRARVHGRRREQGGVRPALLARPAHRGERRGPLGWPGHRRRPRDRGLQRRRHHAGVRHHRRPDPVVDQHAAAVGRRSPRDQPADDHVGPGHLPRRAHPRRPRHRGHHDQHLRRLDLRRGVGRRRGVERGPGRPELRRRPEPVHRRGRPHRPAGLRLVRAVRLRAHLHRLGQAGRLPVAPRRRVPELPRDAGHPRRRPRIPDARAWRSWCRWCSSRRSTSSTTRRPRTR